MFIRVHSWFSCWLYLSVPIFLSLPCVSLAQGVLAPRPPEFSQEPPAAIVNGLPASTNRVETALPETEPVSTPSKVFDLGPVHLRPHLFYRFSYGDGIQPQPGHQTVTAVNEISPGLLINVGEHWHLDYTPTLRYYSSSAFRDSLDHAVSLTWSTIYQDWLLDFSQSYVTSSEPLAETGSQTDQETYATSLSAVYQVNGKVSMDFAANQNFRFVGQSANTNQLSDSRTWSTTEGMNYQVSPGFSLGLSAGFTYDDLSVGSDMTSEQLQGRVNWRIGTKLTLALSGGLDYRQFLNSHQPASVSPIANLSLFYQLLETTTLTAAANQTVSPSYFESQLTTSTAITAGIRQRFFGKLYLDVSAGYSTTSYHATSVGLNVNRIDDHANLDVRLTCPFLTRATASLFYNWSENLSNQPGFQYTSNQGGFELGYRF